MKTNLLDLTLKSLSIDLYAKIVLDLLDQKLRESLVRNVKSSMTKEELLKMNKIAKGEKWGSKQD